MKEGREGGSKVGEEKFKVLYFGSKLMNNFHCLEESEACYKRPYSYKIPVDSLV